MRISNQMVLRSSQGRLQSSLQGVDQLREDISSGITIRKMSDNPTSSAEVVRVGSSLRAIARFRQNSQTATTRATAEESALDQLTNTLTRASELAVSQASGTSNAQTRLIAKGEVDQLITYGVSLANTKVGDDYLFAGTRAGEQPFQEPATAATPFSRLQDALGASVNPSGSTPVEVGDGTFVTPNHNGTEVFLNTDALESLRALSTALGNNDVPGITAALGRVNAANSNVQTLIGTQGARANELDNARINLNSLELTLTTFRSDLRDTEVDKALAELVGKQTLYQAAMGATSKILSLSLANYI
jgi:flagellar hook-associated protein 3 FlgL